MELKKLDPSFYADNVKVLQALDFDMSTESWMPGKVRGHGVVQVAIKELTFAIPVRSFIKHEAAYILEIDRVSRHNKGMGLDYTKALLITNKEHISEAPFILKSKSAGKKLRGKVAYITQQFNKYVEKYIYAVTHNKNLILGTCIYKYTTLINYHKELGLS